MPNSRHAGQVVSREDLMARVWDVNWFGSTKTLDVHIRWLSQARRRPVDPTIHRDRAGRRVPVRRAGGGDAVSLRATLLLALAYVLLLAMIALGVPLAISLRDRVDSEVRAKPEARRTSWPPPRPSSSDPHSAAGSTASRDLRETVRGRVIVVNGTVP